MLDMEEVTAALTTPMAPTESPKGEAEYAGEMDGHASMMCEVLKNQGRLEAKLDMLLAAEAEDDSEDMAESETETTSATDGVLSLPSSSQADFYMPMDFMTMGA